MANAKEELLEEIDGKEVEYIKVVHEIDFRNTREFKGTLNEVIDMLDFEYDSGYGSQELYGYIWYTDGTWSQRNEYDGSEWWSHMVVPDKNDKVY